MTENQIYADFNTSGKLFATSSRDNRIYIYNTQKGRCTQKFTDKATMMKKTTCLRFCDNSQEVKKNETPMMILAKGTASGEIVLYNLNEQSGSTELAPGGSKTSVNAISFCRSTGLLYASYEKSDAFIRVWNLSDGSVSEEWTGGKKISLSQIDINKQGDMLLASKSSSIMLYDVSSKEVLKKFSGHTSAVKMLSFTERGNFFVSASSDQHINLWNVNEIAPIKSFTSASVPHHIRLESLPKKSSYVLFSFSSSSTQVWRFEKSKVNDTKIKQNIQELTIKDRSKSTLMGALSEGALMRATGELVKPKFEPLAILDGDKLLENFKQTVTSEDAKAQEEEESKKPSHQEMVNKAKVLAEYEHNTKLNGKQKEVNAEVAKAARKKLEKVRSQDSEQMSKSLKLPSSGSIEKVFSQAIHLDDLDTINWCITQGQNLQTVQKTIERYPKDKLQPLLLRLIDIFQSAPMKANLTAVWIKSILSQHAPYLVTFPTLAEPLMKIYSLIDTRTATYEKLIKVQGKLNFLLQFSENAHSRNKHLGVDGKPLLYFNEEANELQKLGEISEDEADLGSDDDEEGSGIDDSVSSDEDNAGELMMLDSEEEANAQSGVSEDNDDDDDDDDELDEDAE